MLLKSAIGHSGGSEGKEDQRKSVELILLSGASGAVVGHSMKLNSCQQVLDITNDGDSIDYSCLMHSGRRK